MEERTTKEFYNDFLESRMIEYRIKGNERIDKALETISKYTTEGCNVFDAGCGIGLASEQVSKIIGDNGKIWACDLSDKNIWYANKTIQKKNITFFEADLINDQQEILNTIPKNTIDVIYLVDVIEHIPIDAHEIVFNIFKKLLNGESYIILTYPSPQFQKYLKENKQEELQIIDQIIELDHILEIAKKYDLSIQHYSLEKVWNTHNQYVHCVLQTDSSLRTDTKDKVGIIKKIQKRLKWEWNKKVIYPYRRAKYVNSIFQD